MYLLGWRAPLAIACSRPGERKVLAITIIGTLENKHGKIDYDSPVSNPTPVLSRLTKGFNVFATRDLLPTQRYPR